jgi:hypothetical protein
MAWELWVARGNILMNYSAYTQWTSEYESNALDMEANRGKEARDVGIDHKAVSYQLPSSGRLGFLSLKGKLPM